MQVGTLAAAPGGKAVRQHPHDRIELLTSQRSIGPGPTHQRVQLFLVPFLSTDLRHQLLCEYVERLRRDAERVELARAYRSEQRGTFDQLVAAEWQQSSLGNAVYRMIGAAGALQEGGDGARRAELAHQLDIADVDAELQRRGCHQRTQSSALQSLLGIQTLLLGQTAVVRCNVLLADSLAQMACDTLDHAARVGEDECRAVLVDQLRQLIV